MRILAISLDLDDTLWPILPVMARAEERLDAWLRRHCPAVAETHPIPAMRALRERIAAENPHLAHDFTAQRLLTLQAALEPHGYGADHQELAFAEYIAARNEVEPYVDALPALRRLAARVPLVSVTNGNADLERIGLRHYFATCVSAREHGMAKPAPAIFHAACARLGIAPEYVLHVGDDPLLDVHGARTAGLRAAWLNRTGAAAPSGLLAADFTVTDLLDLAERVEALLDAPAGTAPSHTAAS